MTLASFTDIERDLLVQLPRRVAGAASAAQHDNANRTHQEMEAGFLAVANGRQTGNAFVAEVATATMDIYDLDQTAADIDVVLEQVRSGWQLLRAKAPGDAGAYGRWLLTITDDVITAARSDGVLGVGGALVTPAEQAFRDRVAQILTS